MSADQGLSSRKLVSLAAFLGANIARRRPLRLAQQRALMMEILAEAERVDALEEFQRLRALSGEVVRLPPALAVVEGGRR